MDRKEVFNSNVSPADNLIHVSVYVYGSNENHLSDFLLILNVTIRFYLIKPIFQFLLEIFIDVCPSVLTIFTL